MAGALHCTRFETPIEYAQRRANETGRAYVVSAMGHAMVATRGNRRLVETELGGAVAVLRRDRRYS
jgi:hypothetical protein